MYIVSVNYNEYQRLVLGLVDKFICSGCPLVPYAIPKAKRYLYASPGIRMYVPLYVPLSIPYAIPYAIPCTCLLRSRCYPVCYPVCFPCLSRCVSRCYPVRPARAIYICYIYWYTAP